MFNGIKFIRRARVYALLRDRRHARTYSRAAGLSHYNGPHSTLSWWFDYGK